MFTSTHVGPNDRTSARIVALAPALACVSGVPGAFAQQKEDSAMSLKLTSTAFAHGGEIGRAAAVPRRGRGPFDSPVAS